MRAARHGRAEVGFTLIELLVVVAIIAIVAAISIPNLLNASQRGRQSGSLAEMRSVATTLERYATDTGRYPQAADVRALGALLEPDYIGKLPVDDAWGNMLVYQSSPDGRSYSLRSLGSDGLAQQADPQGPTGRHADDIICANGSFLQWPEGRQQ